MKMCRICGKESEHKTCKPCKISHDRDYMKKWRENKKATDWNYKVKQKNSMLKHCLKHNPKYYEETVLDRIDFIIKGRKLSDQDYDSFDLI